MNPPVITITRTFDAPREAVFDARLNPEIMKQRQGPKGFTCPVATIDPRVGWKSHICMRSPDGQDFRSTGTYKEIVAPERIVTSDSFADENGNIVPASHYGMESDFPLELEVRVTFTALDNNKTSMTMEHIGIPPTDAENCSIGRNESFDKLEAYFKTNAYRS